MILKVVKLRGKFDCVIYKMKVIIVLIFRVVVKVEYKLFSTLLVQYKLLIKGSYINIMIIIFIIIYRCGFIKEEFKIILNVFNMIVWIVVIFIGI